MNYTFENDKGERITLTEEKMKELLNSVDATSFGISLPTHTTDNYYLKFTTED